MSAEKLPHAVFQEHPPTVLFEDAQINGEVAAELFSGMVLHLYNAGVSKENVVYVGDIIEPSEGVGFKLEPDTDTTRTHGWELVGKYNEQVERTNGYDASFLHGLGARLMKLATARVHKKN